MSAPLARPRLARTLAIAEAERDAAMAKHAAFMRTNAAADEAGDDALAEFALYGAQEAVAYAEQVERTISRLLEQHAEAVAAIAEAN